MRVCHSSAGVSPLAHQPYSGTGALQQHDASSSSHTGNSRGQQQPPPRESASQSQEGRAYGALQPTHNRHRGDSWRSEVLPETVQRTGVLESQRWGTQQSRLNSLSQLHLVSETAAPGPPERQSQQVLPHEGKLWHKAFGADASITAGLGHQVSADSLPARDLHR